MQRTKDLLAKKKKEILACDDGFSTMRKGCRISKLSGVSLWTKSSCQVRLTRFKV